MVYIQTRHLDPAAPRKYSNPTAAHGPAPAVTHPQHPHPHPPGTGPLVVTEGVADGLRAVTAGRRAIAVISASVITPAVADTIVRTARGDGVVLAFDNDPAGRHAQHALTELLDGRIPCTAMRMPAGADLTDTYRTPRTAHQQPDPMDHAAQLRDRLNQLTHPPTWADAAHLGVELVDHPATRPGMFHLANGAAVHPTSTGWEAVDDARTGITIRSGTWTRIHNPGINPAARIHPNTHIDPTARIESGAVIAAHAHIAEHAHIGRDAHIGAASYIAPGVFIGTAAQIRGGCYISNGAVIGAGADIGATTQIGAGARITQRTVLEPHSAVTAGDLATGRPFITRTTRPWDTRQIAQMIERLAAMNREP